jgi:dynein heavy chain
LEIRGEETIPESASALYERNDTLRKYVANLDLTVQWYNKTRETVIEVEFPLIEGHLADIDAQLERAEKDLNWNGDGMLKKYCMLMFYFSISKGNLLKLHNLHPI